jgi:hypothetical protein
MVVGTISSIGYNGNMASSAWKKEYFIRPLGVILFGVLNALDSSRKQA